MNNAMGCLQSYFFSLLTGLSFFFFFFNGMCLQSQHRVKKISLSVGEVAEDLKKSQHEVWFSIMCFVLAVFGIAMMGLVWSMDCLCCL